MDNKNINLKEKLKQALSSTARAISDDYEIKNDFDQNKSSKKFDFFPHWDLVYRFKGRTV